MVHRMTLKNSIGYRMIDIPVNSVFIVKYFDLVNNNDIIF